MRQTYGTRVVEGRWARTQGLKAVDDLGAAVKVLLVGGVLGSDSGGDGWRHKIVLKRQGT
jgi:hypothetical protein